MALQEPNLETQSRDEKPVTVDLSLDPSAGEEIGTPNRSSVAFQDLTFCVKEWKLSREKGKLPELRREGKTILNGVRYA